MKKCSECGYSGVLLNNKCPMCKPCKPCKKKLMNCDCHEGE